MGLRVEAPDVDVSGARFTVTDQVIHFGLAAIKNVGGAAIESIVKAREQDGPLRLARRLLRQGRPSAGQPPRGGEPDQGRRLRLSGRHAGGAPLRSRPGHGSRTAEPARPRGGTGLAVREPRRIPKAPSAAPLTRRRDADAGVAARGSARGREGSAGLLSLRPSARRVPGPDPASQDRLGGRARDAARRLAGAAPGSGRAGSPRTPPRAATGWPSRPWSWSTARCRSPYSLSRIAPARWRSDIAVRCWSRGRVDDSDKGRVVLAEEVKPLDEATIEPPRA